MRDVLHLGLGITAVTALESLVTTCRVVGVVRHVDLREAVDDPVLAFARCHGIPVLDDTSIAGVRRAIDERRPECVVISSFDRILPADLVSSCPFVNVHYAPLPSYRGRANVNWAVINREPFGAITIHVVDAGLDSGNVLFQRAVPIARRDTVADVYGRLNELQLEHLGPTVARFLAGDKGQPQASESATYGCTRLPIDGEIDWTASTDRIDALIRGLADPFPGAFTYLSGRRLVIWKAHPVDQPPTYAGRIPGRVVQVSRRDGSVDVLTGDGVLRILDVEIDNDGKAPAARVIGSVRTTLGLRTADLLARIDALEREVAWLREQSLTSGVKHVQV